MMLLRHLVSIAVLPFMAAVVIPAWLAVRNNVHFAGGASLLEMIGVGSHFSWCKLHLHPDTGRAAAQTPLRSQLRRLLS